ARGREPEPVPHAAFAPRKVGEDISPADHRVEADPSRSQPVVPVALCSDDSSHIPGFASPSDEGRGRIPGTGNRCAAPAVRGISPGLNRTKTPYQSGLFPGRAAPNPPGIAEESFYRNRMGRTKP